MDARHGWVPRPDVVGEEDLPFLLRTASQRLARLVAAELGEPSLASADLENLHLLVRGLAPTGIRQAVLAEYLGVRQQSLSRRMLALERAGMLDLERHPRDGRVVLAGTSEAGLEVVRRYRKAVGAVLNHVGDHLDLDAAERGHVGSGVAGAPNTAPNAAPDTVPNAGPASGAAGAPLDSVTAFAVTARTLAVIARACA